MASLKSKCATLEAEQQGMKKKVNPKVLSMIDRFVFRFRFPSIVSVC